jgi:hypothetical protein
MISPMANLPYGAQKKEALEDVEDKVIFLLEQ